MLPEQRRALWTLAAIAAVVLAVGGTQRWRAYQERKAEADGIRESLRKHTLHLPPSLETWRNFATRTLGDAQVYRAWVQERFSCQFVNGSCRFKVTTSMGDWLGDLYVEAPDGRGAMAEPKSDIGANVLAAGVAKASLVVDVKKWADAAMKPHVNACWLARYHMTAMLLPIYGQVSTALLLDQLVARDLHRNYPAIALTSYGDSCILLVSAAGF